MLKPAAVWVTCLTPGVRDATMANARWLLGSQSTRSQRRALGKAVVSNFYENVLDFGVQRRTSRDETLRRLESVIGEPAYDAARALHRGAVLVTAHLGCFETAIAMLSQKEKRIHVVFKRDTNRSFERLRAEQHASLGVLEAPTDDGLSMWIRMRDALRSDEVVLIQGDRVSAGENAQIVPFLGGHMRFPPGPVKLARIAGAPIIPAFAVHTEDRRIRMILGEPIWPVESAGANIADPALVEVVAAIERCVQRYPSQWLVLHRAWCEDQPAGSRT